jgi:hypothetical protein
VQSRFSVDVPGAFRIAWYRLRFGKAWREHCVTWVTDRLHNERFALSAEDNILLDVLLENMHPVIDEASVPLHRSNKYWTRGRIHAAKDRVLAAISDHRHGNSLDLQYLRAITPSEWKAWLLTIVDTAPADTRG